jgi:ankyrin repeat protein
VNVLLGHINDIDVVNSALACASRNGHGQVVKRILQHPGVDIEVKVDGCTPLFSASSARDHSTIATLLEAGANPMADCVPLGGPRRPRRLAMRIDGVKVGDSTGGVTPFYQFCSHPAQDSVSYRDLFHQFLEAGADVHARVHTGQTALHAAVRHVAETPVMTRLLLDAGADANAVTNDGSTPLHQCLSLDAMILLVEHGNADINRVSSSTGQSPLHIFVRHHFNYRGIVFKLIEYGANVNLRDKSGDTVLHVFFQSLTRDTNILKEILTAGGDPNLKNHAGQTCMHDLQIKQSHESGLQILELVDILLEAGANLDELDNEWLQHPPPSFKGL